MRNEVHKLLASYYRCLNGNTTVPVFQGAVPIDQQTDYILIRSESETDASNKTYFATVPVIVVEAVTFHVAQIDASRVEVLDSEVRELIFPTRRTTGLPNQDDIQIMNVRFTDAFYDDYFDGQRYVHRKICRYSNRINQQLLNNS